MDAANNIYVTGSTSSNNDLLLVNPTQSTFGGNTDAFLARFNTDTSTLDFSTYLGGGSADTANAVAVDAQGSAYVVGTTTSANFPTANPLQPSLRGQDAFISEVRHERRPRHHQARLARPRDGQQPSDATRSSSRTAGATRPRTSA